MFRDSKTEVTIYDDLITRVHAEMLSEGPDHDEYGDHLKYLERLAKLKEDQKKPPRAKISGDTVLLVIGNLVGILFIVGHERTNVLTSKAISFVGRVGRPGSPS